MRWFKAAGYRVEAHYVDRDLGESLKSMGERFRKNGRWVPVDVAAQGHEDAAYAYHQVAPYVDESSLRIANPSTGGKPTYEVVHHGGKEYSEVRNAVRHAKHRTKGV